jgi:hypothetical protein
MSDDQGKIVLRIQARGGVERAMAVDVLALPHGERNQDREPFTRQLRAGIPFEHTLVDAPCTIIVRASAPSVKLVATCDMIGPDGARRMVGRSANAVSVFVYTGSGILVSGLPDPESDSDVA